MEKKIKTFYDYPSSIDRKISDWQKEGSFEIISVSVSADNGRVISQIIYTENRQDKESKLFS